jgi:chromate transport protein ChrA
MIGNLEIEENKEDSFQEISLKELAKEVWPYGFISYGGPMAHIGMFRSKFVN